MQIKQGEDGHFENLSDRGDSRSLREPQCPRGQPIASRASVTAGTAGNSYIQEMKYRKDTRGLRHAQRASKLAGGRW